ncbi:MAG: hypothetical protein DRI92_01130 [Aquificota bacterium]|nr:MAG: hypothetical protein DRI92_01130 [Aquificota bacterium]
MDLLKIVEEDHQYDWVRAYETLGENPALRGIIILVFVVGALLSLAYFLKDYQHFLQLIGQTKTGLLSLKKLAGFLTFIG